MTLEQIRMWLASETVTPQQADRYIAVITQIETERIIKLIEPEIATHKKQGLKASADYLTHLIALIKGENK